jgi:exopolysaccharide biosynthesis predicted pyruvyltransferase EpsI
MSIVEILAKKIDEIILPILPSQYPDSICIIDVPDYPNVGDPAILLGEVAFLRKNFPKSKLKMLSHGYYSSAVDRDILESDVIFLQGGGNFGDLWPLPHEFRLKMLKRFSSKTVIQFPQSIYFSDNRKLQEMRDCISSLKDFKLITRDEVSYEFAMRSFDCDVYLSPDMAFAIGPIVPAKPRLDLFCLLRTDKERLPQTLSVVRNALEQTGCSFEIADWVKNRFNIDKLHRIVRPMARSDTSRRWLFNNGAFLYEAYAGSRVKHGVDLLGRGKIVVTDRLHGHIISTLMGKEQVILDSFDGKVENFNRTWLHGFKKANIVRSAEDAIDIISSKILDNRTIAMN